MNYVIGKVDMTLATFYQSDCSENIIDSLQVSKVFESILNRVPIRNPRLQYQLANQYILKQVPVYLEESDYLAIKSQSNHRLLPLLNQWQAIQTVTIDEVAACKYKRLLSDGTYGKREYIGLKRPQKLPFSLKILESYYQFMHYSFAAEVGFASEQVNSYEAFDELYGQHIYSVMIHLNNQTIPLLWPDYLYHFPENHLEFGFLKSNENLRYRLLNQWQGGEKITIEIWADGFEDVCLVSELKPNLESSIEVEETTEAYLLHLPTELAKTFYPANNQGKWYVNQQWQILPGKWINDTTWFLPKHVLNNTERYQIKWESEKYGTYLTVIKKKI